MKKFTFLLAFVFSMLSAPAKVEFQSLNNYDNHITIVFTLSQDD